MLDWLVNEQGVEPHIPVVDKSNREDGTFSRSDFDYDQADDLYRCPGGKELKRYRRAFSQPRTDPPPDDTHRYRATKADCDACTLKSQCCPNTPARKVKVERARHHETAHRLLSFTCRVFCYAVATAHARRDPAEDLRGALVSPMVKHYAAMIEPVAFGGLLRAIDGYPGQLALRLAPHVVVCPTLFVLFNDPNSKTNASSNSSSSSRRPIWDGVPEF